jgi:hypothetical protein
MYFFFDQYQMPRRNDKRDAILSDISNGIDDETIMSKYELKKNVLSRYKSMSVKQTSTNVNSLSIVEEEKFIAGETNTYSETVVQNNDAPTTPTLPPHVPTDITYDPAIEQSQNGNENSPTETSSNASNEDDILQKIERNSPTISEPNKKSYLMPIGAAKKKPIDPPPQSQSIRDKYRHMMMRPPQVEIFKDNQPIQQKITTTKDRDIKPIDIIPPQLKIDEKTTHQDLITKIRNYSICYEQDLLIMFGPTKLAYEKFFRDKIFSMNNAQLESTLERIRVTVTGNSNYELMLKASEIVSGIIEMLLTKVIGLNMNGFSKNLTEDPQWTSSVKQMACELTLRMSPERQMLLCALRVAIMTYKLNQINNTESTPINIDSSKVNEIAEKYKHL